MHKIEAVIEQLQQKLIRRSTGPARTLTKNRGMGWVAEVGCCLVHSISVHTATHPGDGHPALSVRHQIHTS